jgi:hypothetical protein
MSIISSKQPKKHAVVDPVFVLLLLVLVLALLVFAPLTSNMSDPFRSTFASLSNPSPNLSAKTEASFASDLRYWDTYCSKGWTSDAVCEAIVARSQSCAIRVDSAYCSQYENYMKRQLSK